MCIIQTKCGAKGGSASLTVNHSCCEGDSWVENIRWQLYSGTERSSLHDDGVCEQAYDRVCDETGGQRRRRMRAGVRPCVQRNGRSTTTAYASRRTSVLVSTTEEFQLSVIDIHRDVVCGTIIIISLVLYIYMYIVELPTCFPKYPN